MSYMSADEVTLQQINSGDTAFAWYMGKNNTVLSIPMVLLRVWTTPICLTTMLTLVQPIFIRAVTLILSLRTF